MEAIPSRHERLLEELQAKRAPILAMNTSQLGDLFAFGFNAYDSLGHEFEDASFREKLFTPQYVFPSLAHHNVLSETVTPAGGGEALDKLHMHLRNLSRRTADIFMPTIRELIGEEADCIKQHRHTGNGNWEIIEEYPPSDGAKRKLASIKEFTGTIADSSGKRHPLLIPNVPIPHLREQHCILETALALKEQAFAAFARKIEVFEWIRDCIHLQSVETVVRIHRVMQKAIRDQYPGTDIDEYGLVVPLRNRLDFADAVGRHVHAFRSQYALYRVIESGTRCRASGLCLESIGESSEGFHVREPLDVAAILYVIPINARLLTFSLPEAEQVDRKFSQEEETRIYEKQGMRVLMRKKRAALPDDVVEQLEQLAEDVSRAHSLDEVRMLVMQSKGLFGRLRRSYAERFATLGEDAFTGLNRALGYLESAGISIA